MTLTEQFTKEEIDKLADCIKLHCEKDYSLEECAKCKAKYADACWLKRMALWQ